MWIMLSDLPRYAGPNWTEADLRPYIEATLETLVPEHTIYARDYHILIQATNTTLWVVMTRSTLRIGRRLRQAGCSRPLRHSFHVGSNDSNLEPEQSHERYALSHECRPYGHPRPHCASWQRVHSGPRMDAKSVNGVV
jgi:hypothetical protein